MGQGSPLKLGLLRRLTPSEPARPARLQVGGSSSPRARARGLGAGRVWRWFPWSTQSAARPGGGASNVGCASLRPTAGGLSEPPASRAPRAGRWRGRALGPAGCRRAVGRGKVSMRSGSGEGGRGRRRPVRARTRGPPAAAGGGGGSSSVRGRRVGRLAAGAAEAAAAASSGSGAPRPPTVMSCTPSGAAPASCPSLRASHSDLGLLACPIPAARCCS